ncbi:MAG: hypothetical protein NWQ46_01885 [Spirosomaceae bacterium]|nr:hypothetical protein [Spirosomataceae bacterium]
MKQRRYWLVVVLAVCLVGCNKNNPDPDSPVFLLKSVITSDRATELQRITTTFTYDENDLLIERRREDTTFFKASGTFLASQRTIRYTYVEDGLLSKSTQNIVSLTDFRTVESNFSYRNGLLVSEKVGDVITNYSYNDAGELTRTETIFSRGGSSTTDYRNGIPTSYQAEGSGFSSISGNIKSYFNADLQLIRREQINSGLVVSLEERSYHAGKSYYDALPDFKGFPFVKSETYGGGIGNVKQVFSIENGQRILIEEEKFTPIFNANGFLISNKGEDRFQLNTSSPKVNFVTYEYEYSR